MTLILIEGSRVRPLKRDSLVSGMEKGLEITLCSLRLQLELSYSEEKSFLIVQKFVWLKVITVIPSP